MTQGSDSRTRCCKYLERKARASTANRRSHSGVGGARRGVREYGAVNHHKVELKEQAKRERENRAHRCPQPKEGEKSHEQSVRRVIWLRESNKRIEKRIEKLPPDQGCSGRLQCELQTE